jgi:hypothetical protein
MNHFARNRGYEPRRKGKPEDRDDKCAHSGAF